MQPCVKSGPQTSHILCEMRQVQMQLQEYQEASRGHEQWDSVSSTSKRSIWERIRDLIGICNLNVGIYLQALATAEQAVAIFREIKDHHINGYHMLSYRGNGITYLVKLDAHEWPVAGPSWRSDGPTPQRPGGWIQRWEFPTTKALLLAANVYKSVGELEEVGRYGEGKCAVLESIKGPVESIPKKLYDVTLNSYQIVLVCRLNKFPIRSLAG